MDKRQPQSEIILIEISQLWDGWSYRINHHISTSSTTFYALELHHVNEGIEDERGSIKGFQSTEDVKTLLIQFIIALGNGLDSTQFLHRSINYLIEKPEMASLKIGGNWVRNKNKLEDAPPVNLRWEDDENCGIEETAK